LQTEGLVTSIAPDRRRIATLDQQAEEGINEACFSIAFIFRSTDAPMPSSPAHGFWLGVGLSAGAEAGEVIALVEAVIARSGLDPALFQQIASIETRRNHPALLALSTRFQVPVALFEAAVLEAETARLKNPSEALFVRIHCHGVAEAAALAAGGPQAELIVEKTAGRHMTVAIAAAPDIR